MDRRSHRFRSEVRAYDLLRSSPVPVPEVLLLDETHRIVPCDVLVTTRMPGTPLVDSWRSRDPVELRHLVRQSGVMLALIHSNTFKTFGKLRQLDTEPYVTWTDYFEDYAHRYITAASRLKLIDQRTIYDLWNVVDRERPRLARVNSGVLVHSDFHYENILQLDGEISGILDFEWALSGDASYDFMCAPVREAMISGSEDDFTRGYVRVRPFDDEHDDRVALYQLFLALENAVDLARHGRRIDADGSIERVRNRLRTQA